MTHNLIDSCILEVYKKNNPDLESVEIFRDE